MSPWTISLQSVADLTLGLLHNPYAPPPTCCASRGPTTLSGVHMVASRIVFVILIPFRLSLISYFMLSLKCFSSVPNNCPDTGIRPLLQFLHLPRAGPITLTLFFTPTSFILASFVWFYSSCQVLIPAVSSCSASSPVSEGIFLMNPWREMYSTSIYSSTILFFLTYLFELQFFCFFQIYTLEWNCLFIW